MLLGAGSSAKPREVPFDEGTLWNMCHCVSLIAAQASMDLHWKSERTRIFRSTYLSVHVNVCLDGKECVLCWSLLSAACLFCWWYRWRWYRRLGSLTWVLVLPVCRVQSSFFACQGHGAWLEAIAKDRVRKAARRKEDKICRDNLLALHKAHRGTRPKETFYLHRFWPGIRVGPIPTRARQLWTRRKPVSGKTKG